jgi:hypothetical protein
VAVAVGDLPSVVLDEHDLIVEVNAAAEPWFGQYIGQDVFAGYPLAEALFRPHFERARRMCSTVEFAAYYDGTVAYVTATPSRTRLDVTWKPVGVLDTMTLAGLRVSLEAILARLDKAESELARDRVRDSLRVVMGGA